MLSSMTLAEIQAKYSGIHTPEEIEQFHQNMTNSKKWKIVKNEWTWDGLNHVQLRGRALQCKKKQPASKKKPVDDELYSDDSDLESCDEDDE